MSDASWTRIAETGSFGALRVAGWVSRVFGRRIIRAGLWPVACYFYLRNEPARRGSLQYQARLASSPEGRSALGRAPGALLAIRHIHEFAINIYDRILIWGGAIDRMQIEHDDSERIFELAEAKQGGILLGAHLGSLDVLGFLSHKHDLRITIVAFHGNAERVNAFLESKAPDLPVRMIDIDPTSVQAAFEIRACVERGELVAILADRVPPGGTHRVAETKFLGRPAAFPLAPFLLPGVLGCPVFLAFCVSIGDARYRTALRRLSDGRRVPRAERDKRAGELLERYVYLLEACCVQYPLQWFNFYEFWEEGA